MANKNSSKHIALTVGANTGLSVGQMRQDLKSIMKTINHNPPEVKIALAKSSINTIQREIQNAINNGKYTVNFSGNASNGTGGKSGNNYLAQQAYKISKQFGSTGYKTSDFSNVSGQETNGIPKNISSKISANSSYLNEYKQTILEVESALNRLDIAEMDYLNGNLIDSNGNVIALDKHEKEIEDLVRAYTKLDVVQKAIINDNKTSAWSDKQSLSIKKATDRILEYEKNYGNIIAKNPELSNRLQTLKSHALNGDMDSKALTRELLDIQIAAKNAGLEADSTSDKFRKLFTHNLTERAISQALRLLSSIMTEVYQKATELDKAITDLQIATGFSKDETRALVGEYSSLAKSVGGTTTEVAQAADAWLRQGYSVDSANTLIKNSMMLSKLGQIESAEATTALTSAMKGYNLTVEDTTSIVDKLTSVDMEAAVSAGDLAIAMAETNTGARIAGVGIDRLIGYIATVAEVTQDGAESVGTFYKTLFARMGNIKAGQLVDPETSEDLSDVENVLKGVGIHLRESGGEFRNFGDVLDDVALKWNDYGTVQQRAIAVAFSGTRQQEKFLTLMEHYDEAMNYAETATNSAGTALEKYNTSYLTSAEAAQNRLTASIEEFSQTILSSATLVDFFDGAADVISGTTSLIDNLGGLSNVLTILGNVVLLLNFNNVSKGVNTFVQNVSNGSGVVFGFAQKLNKLGTIIDDTRNLTQGGVGAFKAFKTALTATASAGAIASTAIMGVVGVLSIIAMVTKAAVEYNEELYERNRELASSYNENASAIDDYKNRFEELRAKLESNSVTEQEAIQIKEELLSIQEQLIAQYGEKAAGINLVTGEYEKQIDVLNNLTKAEYEYFLTRSNPSKLGKVSDKYSRYKHAGGSAPELNFTVGYANTLDYRKKLIDDIQSKYSQVEFDGYDDTFNFKEDMSIYEYEDFLEELSKSIREVREEAVDMYGEGSSAVKGIDRWAKSVSSALNDIDKELEKNEETFNTYALGTLQHSNEYSDVYGEMITAQKQYNDAIKEGNTEAALESYKKFEEAYKKFGNIYGAIDNKSSADEAANIYVEEFYKAFVEGADKYKVRIQIENETDATVNSAKKFATDFGDVLNKEFANESGKINFEKLIEGYTEYKSIIGETYDNSDDQALSDAGLKEQISIFKELSSLCTKYGVDIRTLLVIMAEMGLVSGEFADSVNDAEDAVQSFSDTMSSLKSAGESIEKLSDAYKELGKNGKVNFSTLNEIQEKFKNVRGIKSYITALAEAEGNTEKTAKVLDKLLVEAVKAELGVENLANANEDLVATMLEENGIANANVVAKKMIENAQNKVKASEERVASVVSDTIGVLGEEINALNMTTNEFTNLLSSQQNFVNSPLDVSQKVDALMTLAAAAGVANAALYPELLAEYTDSYEDQGYTAQQIEALAMGDLYKKYKNDLAYTIGGDLGTQWTPDDSKGEDKNLKAWEEDVAKQKHLLEMDKQTKEQYYQWLKGNYRKRLSDTKKYASEIREIEEELYNWEKEKIQDNIALKESQLENDLMNGQISQLEYQKELAELYKDAGDSIESNADLYGVDEQERLDAVNDMLNKEKAAHNAAYEEEHRQLEHMLAMNLITEEQYLIELARLYDKYYKGNEMYAEEAMVAEEELFSQMTQTIEKWAQAASDAIEAIASAAESTVQAVISAIEGSIDAHEENFNAEKNLLDHSLAMNYISEEEYYNSLEKLYQKYFNDKTLYMEQYWENQEAVYQYEQQMLEDSADAVEDIHGKVVDMIKKELEEAIDAIEETKKSYLDLIDVRRQALNDQKDEEDYNKSRDEQVASIAELQRQLNALANDTSAEGIRKYKEVQEQLREAQDSLAEFEREHTYDQLNKELDNEADAVENKLDKEISDYEKFLDDNIYLTEEAWRRMDGMNAELYAQLMDYNAKYSTSVKDDITDAWETATKALQKYKDASDGYQGILGSIGVSGMTEGEYKDFNQTTEMTKIWNWAKVILNFASQMFDIGMSLVKSFSGIAGGLMPNPLSILSLVLKLAGIPVPLASGTNYVPKSDIYETDEFGMEELKLLKSPHGGRYTFLTEGSKVINGHATERLMKLANNPELLKGRTDGDISALKMSDIAKTLPSGNNMSNIYNTFYIKSNTPEDVASEIEKLMPKIANYTIGSMVGGVTNAGIKRKTQHLY